MVGLPGAGKSMLARHDALNARVIEFYLPLDQSELKLDRARCGARTRTGSPCIAPALGNGRCRMHGGLSTAPRTPEGRWRVAEALRRRWRARRAVRQPMTSGWFQRLPGLFQGTVPMISRRPSDFSALFLVGDRCRNTALPASTMIRASQRHLRDEPPSRLPRRRWRARESLTGRLISDGLLDTPCVHRRDARRRGTPRRAGTRHRRDRRRHDRRRHDRRRHSSHPHKVDRGRTHT
jgi:hypothetical protein